MTKSYLDCMHGWMHTDSYNRAGYNNYHIYNIHQLPNYIGGDV